MNLSLRFLKSVQLLLSIVVLLSTPIANGAVSFIDIWEYRVVGNTLLDQELIQRRLERFLGVARTLDDVEQAAELLTQTYRDEGYPTVFVEIPAQTVPNGVFTLQVNESTIRRVKVTDASYFLPSSIKKALTSLERGRAINLPKFQNEIQAVNTANPNLKVVPILTQGPAEGLIDVELSVADELPVSGGIELNNYSSANTTDSRLIAEIGYTNLWQRHHSWSFTAQTSPEDTSEVKVFSSSYVLPTSNKGDKLAFYVVDSNSETATVGDINTIGKGFIVGGRAIRPLFQEAGNIETLILGFDYKDFDELLVIGGESTTTPIDYLSFTAQLSRYQRASQWYGSMSLALTFGLRGLMNENEEFGNKRSRGEPSFAILKAEFDRNYPFADSWLFSYRANAQVSNGPLVSNEQLSAGGANSVRGYYESQISGDYGFESGIEVLTPEIENKPEWLNKIQFLGFVEAAYLKKRSSGIEEDSSVGIGSFGVGLRAKLFNDFAFKLDSAYPLEHEGADIKQGEIRTHASIKYEF